MASAALVFLAFFAMNKQAFGNYYLLVIGLCSCAVVGLTHDEAKERARERENKANDATFGRRQNGLEIEVQAGV
jgi:hypothetical protein